MYLLLTEDGTQNFDEKYTGFLKNSKFNTLFNHLANHDPLDKVRICWNKLACSFRV